MLTAQEIFDTVVNHLRTLPARSSRIVRGEDMCAYRGRGGSKCAVGCLIADDEYSRSMEGSSAFGLNDRGLLPERLKAHINLLDHLQGIHDCMDYWDDTGFTSYGERALVELAASHGLKFTPRGV